MVNPSRTTEEIGDVVFVSSAGGSLVANVVASGGRYVFPGMRPGPGPTEYVFEPEGVIETAEPSGVYVENALLRRNNAQLSLEIQQLSQRMELLERNLQALAPAVVILRELSREEAKAEILELFSGGDTYDYEDIVKRLGIELQIAVELCDELIAEGELGPVGNV